MLNLDYGKVSNVTAARLILDDDEDEITAKVSTVRQKRKKNRERGITYKLLIIFMSNLLLITSCIRTNR